MQCVSIHALQQLCGMCVFDPLPLFVYTLCIIVYTVFTWPSGNICEVARLRALFMTQFEVRKCGNSNMSCLSRLIAAALKNTQGAQAYPDLIQTSICRPPTMEMVDNSPVLRVSVGAVVFSRKLVRDSGTADKQWCWKVVNNERMRREGEGVKRGGWEKRKKRNKGKG